MKYTLFIIILFSYYPLFSQILEDNRSNSTLNKYNSTNLDPKELSSALDADEDVRSRLVIGDILDQEVIYKRRYLLSPNYKATGATRDGLISLPNPDSRHYVVQEAVSGHQIGRVNLSDGQLNSIFFIGKKIYRLKSDKKEASSYFVFESDSGLALAGAELCEVKHQELLVRPDQKSRSASLSACYVLEVATEADYELYQKYSSNAAQTLTRVLDQMNVAEGIYLNRGINLSFAVVYQNVWTMASDPYLETERFGMRGEFKTVWNDAANGFSAIHRDLAYMVSGKVNTNGGAAFPSTAGDPVNAYAVGQEFDSETDEHLIAHEIGHTLSASHDSGAAVCTGSKPTSGKMCSYVGTGIFCQFRNGNIDLSER